VGVVNGVDVGTGVVVGIGEAVARRKWLGTDADVDVMPSVHSGTDVGVDVAVGDGVEDAPGEEVEPPLPPLDPGGKVEPAPPPPQAASALVQINPAASTRDIKDVDFLVAVMCTRFCANIRLRATEPVERRGRAARRNAICMQLRLIAVDKIRTGYIAEACADFRKRLEPYFSYSEIEVRVAHGGDPNAALREEAERILKHVRPDDRVWLLERSGVAFSSPELAAEIEKISHSGVSRLTFVVAGTYGAADSLRDRADVLWSLSPLTFLHEWSRAIVLEQLYRAAKISRNEPYHH
jgi:23S rRNA (pseudouridine1915-N3)-methyltransferase